MTTSSSEEWRKVAGFEEFYEVSSLGRIRSLDRVVHYPDGRRGYTKPGVILRPTVHPGDKYCRIALYRDGKCRRRVLLHVLILETFVGQRPEGYEARHLNGDGSDNRLVNLQWGTSSENTYDLVRHGTHNNARKTHCKHGHEYTPENTMPQTKGGRQCRECHRIRHRRNVDKYRPKKLEAQRRRRSLRKAARTVA